jgi:hypothetical protein
MGARQGSTVMVTTENEPLRKAVGNTTPVRLLVAGIVDEVCRAPARVGESPAPPTAPLAGAKERT